MHFMSNNCLYHNLKKVVEKNALCPVCWNNQHQPSSFKPLWCCFKPLQLCIWYIIGHIRMAPFIVIQHSQQELVCLCKNVSVPYCILNEPGCVHQMIIKTMQILLICIAPSGLGVRFNAWRLYVLPMLFSTVSLNCPKTGISKLSRLWTIALWWVGTLKSLTVYSETHGVDSRLKPCVG